MVRKVYEEKLIITVRDKNYLKLSSDFKKKMTEFACFVIVLYQRNKYSLSQIGNADETTGL
jgi:hypothetical protein